MGSKRKPLNHRRLFVKFVTNIYQKIIDILMGLDSVPFTANLPFYEDRWIRKTKKKAQNFGKCSVLFMIQ